MDNRPERCGKKWEQDEEDYVLSRVKQGIIPVMIAKEVKRTTGGVISHLREIACRFIKKGIPIEEVSELTGLPADDIQDAIKRRELAQQMKELSPKKKEQSIRTFFSKPEETELDVLKDIRSLLQQLVQNMNNTQQHVVLPTPPEQNTERRGSGISNNVIKL